MNLGLIYYEEKNYEKSIFYFNKTLSKNPNNKIAHYHKGLINFKKKDYEKGILDLKSCINLDKNYKYAYQVLGHIYSRIRSFDKAINVYLKALDIDKEDYKTKFNLGKCYLSTLEFKKGFELYEFRKRIQSNKKIDDIKQRFSVKEWCGQNLKNKTILIISEQGKGDVIQFSRYLFWLKEEFNNKIIFYVDENMKHFFKNSPFQTVSNLNQVTKIDYYQYLLSLPGIYYFQKKSFKECVNYIDKDEFNKNLWKKKLNNYKSPLVGINWQGDPNYKNDDTRSIPLINFKKIITIPDYNFISLQKDFGSEQIHENNFSKYINDFSNEFDLNKDSFKDTISIIENLDLIITSDTSIAHLAGTLKVKTLLLLDYSPDWRWDIELNKKCFYPLIKIIQQKTPGDWDSVFKVVENILIEQKY